MNSMNSCYRFTKDIKPDSRECVISFEEMVNIAAFIKADDRIQF